MRGKAKTRGIGSAEPVGTEFDQCAALSRATFMAKAWSKSTLRWVRLCQAAAALRSQACAALARFYPPLGQEGAHNLLEPSDSATRQKPAMQQKAFLKHRRCRGVSRSSSRFPDSRFPDSRPHHLRSPDLRRLLRALALAFPAALALAGCGGGVASLNSSGGSVVAGGISISPGAAAIDTNCTGCNNAASGYLQFSAVASGGVAANVTWSVSGGDPYSKAGTISSTGQYTPPSYLTADSVQVTVTATSTANPSATASTRITITPGFLQPLAPENVALGASGTVTVTGYIAEVGGTDTIHYATSNSATGSAGGQGTLVAAPCTRGTLSTGAFTYCTATYTAPASITQASTTYIVGAISNTSSTESADVLLNAQGVNSNPAGHQTLLTTPIALGVSGGNNEDYDTTTQSGQTYISDCCGGTLGALVKDGNGNEYILSNNHVLARSDQAAAGEPIIQPGLIDNKPACEPEGQGGNETPVGVLKGFVPVKSSSTNVDAAIASVNSGAVNPAGAILELGAPQANGTLAAAPPGISSSGGRGESASLNMVVAKSGRTTGLTCAGISAVSLDVQVSYYSNCAETVPYYTKTYSNQIGIEGDHFSDAGDSGALIVDTADGEPVGLFFAGGVSNGISEGVANPAGEVLNELSTYVGNGASYTFVGTADHAVSCLDYGTGTAAAAQARTLSGAQMDRVQQAMTDARALVNPSAGIYGVATGKSSDRAGEGAVIVYVTPNKTVNVPATLDGVRTEVIPATPQQVALGTAPQSLLHAAATPALSATVLHQAIANQQQLAPLLMKQTPAFFGVGVGQSLDDPQQAALVIYVDKNQVPAELPQTINGLRTRYIVMDRLHVTRSYLSATPMRSHCMAHPVKAQGFGLLDSKHLPGLNFY